jgi:hypothetical protein
MKPLLAVVVLGLPACGTLAESSPREPSAGAQGFSFSHENSIAERWPFGLDEITTKIVVEPSKAADSTESYWVVRLSPQAAARPAGAFTAQVWIGPEFEDGPFAPRAADYEVLTGVDRNGAVTSALDGGRYRIQVPAAAGSGEHGFIVRARFLGDGDGQEPPKSLLVAILMIVEDATGDELPIGAVDEARWLIVDPDSGM